MTRKLAALEFAGAPGAADRRPRAAPPASLERTLQHAVVALAAEQVGGAQTCLDMSVDYAKLRVQFGRPIGSFQAIKHKCADMLLEVESARSAAYYAAWAVADGTDELPLVAALAKAYCSEAYFRGRGREHPDPRRHRLHLGARRAPVLPAREVDRAVPRQPGGAPGDRRGLPHRPAGRDPPPTRASAGARPHRRVPVKDR